MNSVNINEKIKLLTDVSGFSFFAPDQVLTAGQLNQLIQHLDYQDRATRAWLTGSGLICGFTHRFADAGIVLEPGCALTSDGDILGVESALQFTHRRPFTDENANYFRANEDDAGTPYFTSGDRVIELISEREAEDDDEAAVLEPDFLKDHVLVLYLESYAKEPEFCTGDNCDNKGPVQHNVVRVLCIPSDDVERLPSDFSDLANQLDPVAVARPQLDAGIKNLEGDNGLQGAFTTAISATRDALLVELEKVSAVSDSLLRRYGFSSAPDWAGGLPGGSLNANTEINGLLYYYGFYREVSRAYREWRETLFSLKPGRCGIVPALHPKHVLLGIVNEEVSCIATPYRHRFYRAAALASCSDELERSQLLWDRMLGMISDFTAQPTLQNSRAVSTLPGLNNQIRITPSAACDRPLGEQSVPIFFGNGFDPPWDIAARQQCRFEAPLSYYSNGATGFGFSLCEKPFYRIEGHLGEPLEEVVATLKALRKHYNIAFNILTVQIEDDPDTVRPTPWRFFDLESRFYDYRADFRLKMRDVEGYTESVKTGLNTGEAHLPDDTPTLHLASLATSFKEKTMTASALLPKTFSEFSVQPASGFLTQIDSAVVEGHSLTRETFSFAALTPLTPADRFLEPELPTKYAALSDVFRKRRRKAAELTIFQKFVAMHPGLEHLGGVPKGGTFVLVYSTPDDDGERVVKADLALPYCCTLDLNQLEDEGAPADFEEEPDDPDVIVYEPRPWLDLGYSWNVTDLTLSQDWTAVEDIVNVTLPAVQADIAAQLEGLQMNFTGQLVDAQAEFNTQLNVVQKGVDDRFVLVGQIGTGGTQSPLVEGVAGADGLAVDYGQYQAEIDEIEGLRVQIAAQQKLIDEGNSTPAVRQQLEDLEGKQAGNLSKLTLLVSQNIAAGEAADEAFNQVDGRAISYTQQAGSELRTPAAKQTFGDGVDAAIEEGASLGSTRVREGLPLLRLGL